MARPFREKAFAEDFISKNDVYELKKYFIHFFSFIPLKKSLLISWGANIVKLFRPGGGEVDREQDGPQPGQPVPARAASPGSLHQLCQQLRENLPGKKRPAAWEP